MFACERAFGGTNPVTFTPEAASNCWNPNKKVCKANFLRYSHKTIGLNNGCSSIIHNGFIRLVLKQWPLYISKPESLAGLPCNFHNSC